MIPSKFLCFKGYYQESKKTPHKMRKEKKIFANHVSDKRLSSGIYKEHLKANK